MKTLDEIIADIYKFAHVADGTCENTHRDWKKELHETYKKLRKKRKPVVPVKKEAVIIKTDSIHEE